MQMLPCINKGRWSQRHHLPSIGFIWARLLVPVCSHFFHVSALTHKDVVQSQNQKACTL